MNENNENNEYKAFILDKLKYYGRRFEVVLLIICGVALNLNFELLKTGNQVGKCYLLYSSLAYLICVFISLYKLSLEKQIRELYLQLLTGTEAQKKAADKKSLSRENWGIWLSRAQIILLFVGVVLTTMTIGGIYY